MGLDIKIPIGLMFAIFGAILALYGLATDGNSMYEISLSVNVNLWSGIAMFIFGVGMLLFSDLLKKKNKQE